MSVRIFGIETTRQYQHQHPTSLEDARRQLAELEVVQQETWTALDNEPLPGTIKGFLNRKYPKIYASAGLRQLIAETCEARTLIARRRVAILEAGLLLKQDDWVRLMYSLYALPDKPCSTACSTPSMCARAATLLR